MPTAEQLDQVIVQKQKQISQLQEKIALYNKEVENCIEQLSLKRTELAEQARKTISQLEPEIPKLEKLIVELTKTSNILSEEIFKKEANSKAEEKSCKSHYDSIGDALKADYAARCSKLEELKEKLGLLESNLDNKEKALLRREQEARDLSKSANDIMVKAHKNINENDELFEKTMKKFAEMTEANAKQSQELYEKGESLKKRESNIGHRENFLLGKEGEVSSIVALSNDFEKRENEIKLEKNRIAKRDEELNTANVWIKAETRRIIQKDEALRLREQEINKREENLKIAESQFVAKG